MWIALTFATSVKAQDSSRINNIVLVHGAFVDGSEWWLSISETYIKIGLNGKAENYSLPFLTDLIYS